ncbi:RNA polymerase sigma factor, sigma-70 family [Corynebacterium mustelae]|uniref:RNA polymerase sigma factor, sigma-70 family n=1 Tax=Corynebacterium mustelae TaxID=571915 RepID=A0A0G3H199_9CORY|nr:RNA polymerase sigma factor [Corynebacterium mustelae]AKK07159.1 RNA polymerase sigma factor, sigma-70 family [Corynebacterium mustelae]
MSQQNDTHLVLKAQDGDVAAFEQLIQRYQGRLFRTAYMVLGNRQDSEDVVQETLIQAWRRLHLLREPAAFRGWLLKICTNKVTSTVRRLSSHGTDPHDPTNFEELAGQKGSSVHAGSSASSETDPARTSEVNAQIMALADVLSTVSPELRACWALREVESMSYKEIAHTLNITESTARGRIARARTLIMQRMEEWK